MICELEHKVFTIEHTDFDEFALALFHFQFAHNKVYQQYIELLGIDPRQVTSIAGIPFLPVEFFKNHQVVTTDFKAEIIFKSSGTTRLIQSRHLVKEIALYRQSFTDGFERHYGSTSDWYVLALLPRYLEQEDSSLVFMMNDLIQRSNHELSGFYLHDYEKLAGMLKYLEMEKQKTLLIGVTFALLDFAAEFPQALSYTVVMETGGMKGRRKELTRLEVHQLLKEAFGLEAVHSEYGMTELLSQAYSLRDGVFMCPPWMKIRVREEDDPLASHEHGKGLLNVIDLANIYSCAFIATDDIAEVYDNGKFSVMGRLDNSDLRGCSLLIA